MHSYFKKMFGVTARLNSSLEKELTCWRISIEKKLVKFFLNFMEKFCHRGTCYVWKLMFHCVTIRSRSTISLFLETIWSEKSPLKKLHF